VEKTLDDAIAQFKKHYRDHCLDHTYVYPGVAETLQHFRAKKMAVVTNKPARISRHLLERLGLSVYFRSILGGDSTMRKKPHPGPILPNDGNTPNAFAAGGSYRRDGFQDIQAGKGAELEPVGFTLI